MQLRLKEILDEKGMTGKDFATLLGVSPTVVYRILNDGKTTLKTMEQFANALDVPVWELVVSCGVTCAPPIVNPNNWTIVKCPHCHENILITLNASKL